MAVIESEELSYFATYVSIVILKMVVLSPLTGYFRHTRSVFSNPEDLVSLKEKDKKPIFDDPMVERVRRCHRNDLENIVPFFGLGLLYALTSGASTTTIVWHYRIFVASRFLHTIAYIGALPQPSRALSFFVGLFVNVSMAVQIVFSNPEDMVSLKDKDKARKPIFDDPEVERVRRCHQNDLENIVQFFALGVLFALTSGASTTTIVWHYRVFVASRFIHTSIYLSAVPQPSRAMAFLVDVAVSVSMAVQIIMNNWKF